MINTAIADVLRAIDPTQRVVLRMKLAGVSDTEVASLLGVSRPTAAKRKDEVSSVLLGAIDGLDEPLQLIVLDGLVMNLTEDVAHA